jgi:hypothetical protein
MQSLFDTYTCDKLRDALSANPGAGPDPLPPPPSLPKAKATDTVRRAQLTLKSQMYKLVNDISTAHRRGEGKKRNSLLHALLSCVIDTIGINTK